MPEIIPAKVTHASLSACLNQPLAARLPQRGYQDSTSLWYRSGSTFRTSVVLTGLTADLRLAPILNLAPSLDGRYPFGE
jgi:hypothetical protein